MPISKNKSQNRLRGINRKDIDDSTEDDIVNDFGKLTLVNYDSPDEHIKYRNKHPLAPQWPFRLLIAGPSGCGKTMLTLNLIYDFLDYDTISFYTTTLDKPNIQALKDHIEWLEEATDTKLSYFCNDKNKIKPLSELDPNKQNLVIFDDLCTEKDQKDIIDYFIKGRHHCVSSIYISQGYNLCPSNIRRNCNYIALYDIGDARNVYTFITDHVRGIDTKDFRKLYNKATEEPYNFLLVDKVTTDKRLRYRKNLDTPLV